MTSVGVAFSLSLQGEELALAPPSLSELHGDTRAPSRLTPLWLALVGYGDSCWLAVTLTESSLLRPGNGRWLDWPTLALLSWVDVAVCEWLYTPLSIDSALLERLLVVERWLLPAVGGGAKFSLGGGACEVGVSSTSFMGESSLYEERRPGEEKTQLSAVDLGVSGCFFVGVACLEFGGVACLLLPALFSSDWLLSLVSEMNNSSICSMHLRRLFWKRCRKRKIKKVLKLGRNSALYLFYGLKVPDFNSKCRRIISEFLFHSSILKPLFSAFIP